MSVAIRDITWLAGLWEGEGYFAFAKTSLFMTVDSTDEDVIRRAAALMDAKVLGPYTNGANPRTGEPYKLKWRCQVSGARAAGWMMTLFTELGARRRATIRACLASWMQRLPWRGDRTLCKRGHPLSGENLYVNRRGDRSCRSCERVRQHDRYSLNKLAQASNSTPDVAAFRVSETRKAG